MVPEDHLNAKPSLCAHVSGPTVWHSVAARALGRASQKAAISRAKRSAAMPCSATRTAVLGCRPHAPTTPARYHAFHNERSIGTTPSIGLPPPQRALSGTTRIGNHAAQNEPSAQRAFAPHAAQRAIRTTCLRITRCITSTGTMEVAQRAFRKRDSSHPNREKE